MTTDQGHPRKSRADSIRSQWFQTRTVLGLAMKRSRLDNPDCAFFISALIALFLVQVESALWPPPPAPPDSLWRSPLEGWWRFPFAAPTADQTYGFLWIVLIVALGNSWLLHQGLRRHGSEDGAFRPWVLRLRALLLAPPFLGLAVLPAWRALLNVRPSWALKRRAPLLTLESPSNAGVPRKLPRILSSKLFLGIWIVAVNLAALRCGLAWLNVPQRRTLAALLLAGAVCAALRLLGLACMVFYMVRRMPLRAFTWRRKLLLWGLLLFWVVPSPAVFLFSFAIYLQLEEGRIRTAIYAAYEAGEAPEALRQGSSPGEIALPGPLRWWMSSLPGRTAEGGLAFQRQLGFYRAKVFLLLLDAGALNLTLLWLERHFPWVDWPLGIPLVILLVSNLILLPVSVLSRAWSFAQGFFRPEAWKRQQELYPVMRYVLLSQAAFATGLLLGPGDATGQWDARTLGQRLVVVGTLAFAFGLLFVLPGTFRALTGRGEDRSIAPILWLVAFQMMGQLGEEMRRDPKLAEGVTFLFHGAVLLAPLWAFLLWIVRGSWVLRPYRLRDLRRRDLPAGTRRRLVLIAVTSALPLGGLFVPLWIHMRRGFERQLAAGPQHPQQEGDPAPAAIPGVPLATDG